MLNFSPGFWVDILTIMEQNVSYMYVSFLIKNIKKLEWEFNVIQKVSKENLIYPLLIEHNLLWKVRFKKQEGNLYSNNIYFSLQW